MHSKISSPQKFIGLLASVIAVVTLSSNVSAAIVVDGKLDDWTQQDRLDLTSGTPVNGYALYGRYEDKSYKFALLREQGEISANTTMWLNTDQNTDTGYQIFGSTGGAEFNVNLYSDNKPYLYSGAAAQNFITGPLQYANASNGNGGSVLELVIPEAQIGSPSSSAINLVLDVNDTVFLPSFYNDTNQYVLNKSALPKQVKSGNRVAIVFSETSKNQFWAKKSYAQLFMSVQMQTMMAGVPYDLLNEDDLTDLNKIINYDTLIFPYMPAVPDASYEKIKQNLSLAAHKYNIGIIAAGNLLTNKADGSSVAGDAYATMKSLLGVTRIDGAGPVDIEVRSADKDHLVFSDYDSNELIQKYEKNYTDYFVAVAGQKATVLAEQTINGTEKHEAVIATQTGGRNVHFATVQQMTDANLMWYAIQWSSMGDDPVISLKLGRQDSIFVSRNDMDQSKFVEEIPTVEVPLLSLLEQWKDKYNFIGTYYINVGNNKAAGEYTDWSISAPLYQKYMAMGNEIGTHSYTHPHDTNILTDAQISFEFADSRKVIEKELNIQNIGAAVPGAPEDLRTAKEISQHVSYLSGGYSGVGAGFVNAMGFLTPDSDKVYLSPNMTFDFTNMGFLKHTAEETKQIWSNEMDELALHANQPVIHWPWHDYGPTTSVAEEGYTVDMFDSVISKAYNELDAEFITGADLAERMQEYKKASLQIKRSGNQVDVKVSGANFGKQALKLDGDYQIKSVQGWYAYNENYVFLDKDGGDFRVNLGGTADKVTHINWMPSRSELLQVKGDGKNISFSFNGEGTVEIKLACDGVKQQVKGADEVHFNGEILEMDFDKNEKHEGSVSCRSNPKI